VSVLGQLRARVAVEGRVAPAHLDLDVVRLVDPEALDDRRALLVGARDARGTRGRRNSIVVVPWGSTAVNSGSTNVLAPEDVSAWRSVNPTRSVRVASS
jgi:hypothetical protein